MPSKPRGRKEVETASEDGPPEEAGADEEMEVAGFPTAGDDTVEFGWDDTRVLKGRRAKLEKKQKAKAGTYEAMDLTIPVLRGIKRKGYRLPTPIQRKTIPLILQGLDVVGMARTGSGKTAAFVIPMIQRLKEHSTKAGARAVILSPTRELALQTHKVVRELGTHTDLRAVALVGGDSMEAQFDDLARNPDALVATPGRLIHHLEEVEGMSLRSVEYLVLDEADRLFEMGFAQQVRDILHQCGDNRQTLLFSATLPKMLAEFAKAGLKDPEVVRLDTDVKISPQLALEFFQCRIEDKPAALLQMAREVVAEGQPTVVFISTKYHVEFLFALLSKQGIAATCIYGSMDQSARKINLAKFRAGKVSFLLVTDVAARGIDLPLLDNVINYDFPGTPKLFVHRAGRAARAGRTGTAYSLFTPDELPYVVELHLFLSRPLQPAPVIPTEEEQQHEGTVYGTFPEAMLMEDSERVSRMVGESMEIQAMQRSLANGFRLYVKTRPAAAPGSTKRAKELPFPGHHPMLAKLSRGVDNSSAAAEASYAAFTQHLKTFRPSATVMEASIAPGQGNKGAGLLTGPILNASKEEMMREKRRAHSAIIEAAKKRKEHQEAAALADMRDTKRAKHPSTEEEEESDAPSDNDNNSNRNDESGSDADEDDDQKAAKEMRRKTASSALKLGESGDAGSVRFRDPNFFVPDMPGSILQEEEAYSVGRAGALDGAVMDMTGEDNETISAMRSNYHWDARQKKYIKLQPGEQIKAGKRVKKTESGARVKGKDGGTGLYKKWMQQSKRRVPATGHTEDPKAGGFDKRSFDRFKYGGRNGAKQSQGSNVKDELVSREKVAKMRKEKMKRSERAKGRKGGGGGDDDDRRGGRGGRGGKGGGGKFPAGGGRKGGPASKGPPKRGVQKGGRGGRKGGRR